MAAQPVTGTPPYRAQHGTCSNTPGLLRQVTIEKWARIYTVEAPVGGSDLTVQRDGADESAVDIPQSVPVIAGAGPREFVASPGQQEAAFTTFGIGSLIADAPFIVEIEAARR